MPKISIVVPVKNGMDTLERFIEGVQLQTLFHQTEVVVVDSGSTDGSIDYLSTFSFVNIVSIDPKTFNHGATRNLAVSHCKGDFVLMTVQDAWATDPKLLERMLSHFKETEVMGVCGHQVVPHLKGMNPHQWFRPVSEPLPKTIQFKDGSFKDMSPKAQFSYCGWDNVISMYRKKALEQLPFLETDFAEDLQWSKQALCAGHKIIYDHRNRVNHYHHETPDYVFKRNFIVLYSIYKHFGYKRNLSVPLSSYFKVIYRNFKWRLPFRWISFNIKALLARQRAYDTFITSVNKSDMELEKIYLQVCNVIPQGRQS